METNREFESVVSLPQFPGPSVVTRRNASDDPDTGTAETVQAMQAGAVADSSSPQVWAAVQGALVSASGSSRAEIAEAIYRWICSHVKFRSDDPVLSALLGLDNELDLLIRPARLLTMRRPAEDCDGFTMLCCSMLLAGGVPCEIITIKADHDDPSKYSHVYCQAILEDGRGLVMDPSQGAQHGFPIGWEAPEYFSRKDWGVIHPEGRKGMHGLSGLGETCDIFGCYPDGPDGPPVAQGGGLDWNNIIQSSFGFARQLALKPGQYVQTPGGVMANQVPGAVPGFNLSTSASGIGTGTILLGVGALALILFAGGRK